MNAEQIRNLIASKIEDNRIPVIIAEVLKKHDGKKITKRHIDEIEGEISKQLGENTLHYIYLSKTYGTTKITWKTRVRSKDYDQLYIADTDKNVVIDIDSIIKKNGAWYGALEKRNERRNQLLKDDLALQETAKAISDYIDAKKRLAAIIEKHDFGSDEYCIQNLIKQEVN